MQPQSIETLLECWEKLGPMERSVLNTLAWRLYAGQRKYGPLEDGKKDWTWEAAEEGLDQAVYLAAGLVCLTDASRRRYFAALGQDNGIITGHGTMGSGGTGSGNQHRPSGEDDDRDIDGPPDREI